MLGSNRTILPQRHSMQMNHKKEYYPLSALLFLLALLIFTTTLAGGITGASILQFSVFKKTTGNAISTLAYLPEGAPCTLSRQCKSTLCLTDSLNPGTKHCGLRSLSPGQPCIDDHQCYSGKCYRTPRKPSAQGICTAIKSS